MKYASKDSIEVGERLREVQSLERQVAIASFAGNSPTPAAYLDGLVARLREARRAYLEVL